MEKELEACCHSYDNSAKGVEHLAYASSSLKVCRKYLTWVQNSVFEGKITGGNLKKLKIELKEKMDIKKDSVLIYSFQSTKYFQKEIIGIEKNKFSIFF